MKMTLGSLRKLIREASGDHRARWPWIDHFDRDNEEGVSHPGNWKNPAQADFDAALAKMSDSDLEKLKQRALSALGAGEEDMSYDMDSEDEPVEPDQDQVRAQMFKIWSDSEFRDQRDLQNKYFAPSRKRDADAYAKAMENPETRKMAGMVASRDLADTLGRPWFPDDE